MTKQHPFQKFLDGFIPELSRKARLLNKAAWLQETTGAADAADLKAELHTECRLFFQDAKSYKQLLEWEREGSLNDPILKRQLAVLIRGFKENQLPKELVEAISKKEAALGQCYATFRPKIKGKTFSENEILAVLTNENKPAIRKQVWEASKCIGDEWYEQILDVVALRNKAAKSIGYSDYFLMQLDLQEVDEKWLFHTLADLAKRSDKGYAQALAEIEKQLSKRFKVPVEELGPWAWSEPFCQADPLDSVDLDHLVTDVDIAGSSAKFYQMMGLDVQPILARSDMYERPGKNQHAFCMNIDRGEDVRTLNNVKPSIKWLETVLHELGHAVYDLGFDKKLPWLLREPPHMITTEAMALLAGRQAYRTSALKHLVGNSKEKSALMPKADQSLKRRQLIFSRWVLVMTHFERELYRNPTQDLNRLWWQLVAKYQKVNPPKGRERHHDWAAKVHIGLAPVYYFSYLLGEMLASSIEETLKKETGSADIATAKAGKILQDKLFFPGSRYSWNDLIHHFTGSRLKADDWLHQFSK